MIDLSHIPETPGLSVFLPQSVDDNSWQAWQKPRGFVMATIYAIGPGGGGGSGRAASVDSGTDRGGGAGGGSGGLSRLTIPLFLLPDTLYIRVTPGGSGGASVAALSNGVAGNVAFAPSTTLVSVYPSTTVQYLFLRANAGNGGAAGSTTTATAGTAGAISATTDAPLGNLGATLFIAGNGGAGGPANTFGSSITQGTASQIYGGAGGAGVGTGLSGGLQGGSISALFNTPFAASPGGTSTSLPGGAGFSWTTIFPGKYYGGTGGAALGNGVGGSGGNGGVPGAGGGGGGGGALTSGAGGDGGPGCVIIQCW